MRKLNNKEIQEVSGGIDPCFFYGAIAGASGADLDSTIKNCLLFGGVVGGILSCNSFPPIGIVLGVPVGALVEAFTGYVGYALGHAVAGPTPVVVVHNN